MVFGIVLSVGMMIVPSIIFAAIKPKFNKDVVIRVGTAKE